MRSEIFCETEGCQTWANLTKKMKQLFRFTLALGLDFQMVVSIIRRWLYSQASYAVAFSDLANLIILIAGTQGP